MYWPNVGAYGTSVNLTYPPIWKFQYTCARTNVHAYTNVSLDKSILGHKMSLDNFGQKSARTNVSLDKNLLGQLSQHLASLRHTTHICEQRIDLCLLPDLAQFGKVFAKSRQKMSETKPGSSKSSILSYASCTPNAWKIGSTLEGNKSESQEQLWQCPVAISTLSREKGNETEGV